MTEEKKPQLTPPLLVRVSSSTPSTDQNATDLRIPAQFEILKQTVEFGHQCGRSFETDEDQLHRHRGFSRQISLLVPIWS